MDISYLSLAVLPLILVAIVVAAIYLHYKRKAES